MPVVLVLKDIEISSAIELDREFCYENNVNEFNFK